MKTPKGIKATEGYSPLRFSGAFLVFENANVNEAGTSYVRVVDATGDELFYWDEDEWREAPAEVMGAIMGAIALHNNIDKG